MRRLFPPRSQTPQGQPPRLSKGWRGVNVLTAGGELRLKRRYRWAKGEGGLCPADAVLGIDQNSTSPGAKQLCCLIGMGQNFRQGSADLKKVGGLSLSKEKLRQVVEAEAKQVRKVRDSGALPASWSAKQAKLPDGTSRVYVGVDGVMAPTVTQAEKDKRRRQHITRRQQRGKAGLGNARPLPPAKAGTDEKFKEMKIGTFYDQDKLRRHVFATEEPCRDFGPLLGAHARQIGLAEADQVLGRVDGAVWIYRQVCLALLFIHGRARARHGPLLSGGRHEGGGGVGDGAAEPGQGVGRGGDAGDDRGDAEAGAVGQQEREPAGVAWVPRGASGHVGLRRGVACGPGHRQRADGS